MKRRNLISDESDRRPLALGLILMGALLRLIPRPPGKIISGSAVLDGEDILAVDDSRMREIRTSGSPSGDWKRGLNTTAPVVDSTQ